MANNTEKFKQALELDRAERLRKIVEKAIKGYKGKPEHLLFFIAGYMYHRGELDAKKGAKQ